MLLFRSSVIRRWRFSGKVPHACERPFILSMRQESPDTAGSCRRRRGRPPRLQPPPGRRATARLVPLDGTRPPRRAPSGSCKQQAAGGRGAGYKHTYTRTQVHIWCQRQRSIGLRASVRMSTSPASLVCDHAYNPAQRNDAKLHTTTESANTVHQHRRDKVTGKCRRTG